MQLLHTRASYLCHFDLEHINSGLFWTQQIEAVRLNFGVLHEEQDN